MRAFPQREATMDATPAAQHFSYIPTPTRTTTAELLASSAPPVRWVIPDYIGEGLTILAGRPNSGKSWLALDWAIAVASGVTAMGAIACEPGDVLYVDLENGERRIHARLETFFSRGKPPLLRRLQWLNEAPEDENLVGMLDDWRRAAEAPRLVVIDAWPRLRQPAGPGHHELDSAALRELRRWATTHPIAVVCIMRTPQAPSRDSRDTPANALFACADTLLLLDQDEGGPTLDVRGRDVLEKQMALSFDNGRWSLQGEAADLRLSAERQNILDVLRDHNHRMRPKEIAEMLGVPAVNVRKLLCSMLSDGQVSTPRRGEYEIAG
jgi:AAA domain